MFWDGLKRRGDLISGVLIRGTGGGFTILFFIFHSALMKRMRSTLLHTSHCSMVSPVLSQASSGAAVVTEQFPAFLEALFTVKSLHQ